MQDLLSRKGTQSLRISFINDKVFYTKKNPKTEIKILRKDLNSIRIYALNCIIKATNNILFNDKNLILAKQEFLSKFLFDIKLRNTLKFYGENYKKIYGFVGIENYSNKQKNIYFIRDAYKRYFQLQKVFLLCEKYNYGFSRYLNFVNNQVLVSQINNNNNISSYSVLSDIKNSVIANNQNNNYNINLPVNNLKNSNNNYNIGNKLYRILSFTSTADSNYFNKKKAEAKNSCFANVYVNICFNKWKLLVYRSLNSKIETQKNLIIFIKKIENVFVQKLHNEGKYFLISNIHIENDRLEFNKENESSNLNVNSNKQSNLASTKEKQTAAAKPLKVGSNSKKLILVEEKIKIYTKYNRFVYLTKLEFFENFRRKAQISKITENKLAKMHCSVIFIACNLVSVKQRFIKREFFSALENFVETKSKKLKKQEALKSVITLQMLSNTVKFGKFKSLSDFAKQYYTKLTLRKNTLEKYFSKWKNELRKFLNKVKIQEKFDYEKYRDELSPGVYENNKLFAEKLEIIKQSKIKSNKNSNKKDLLNFSISTALRINKEENENEENENLYLNNEAGKNLNPVSLVYKNNYNNPQKPNQQINVEFGEKVIHFTNNEFEVFFFKILAESKAIPKSKLMFFLHNQINLLHKKNLNFFFKKFRIKLNLYYPYNKLLAEFYSNKNLQASGTIKNEAYFIGLNANKIPSLPEQLGNKIRITAPAKQPKESDFTGKIASFSQKLSVQRIDYLINQNQSRIILDYEQDEMRLDKEINFCKKIVNDKSGYLKLARIFISNKIKAFERCFSKWKNFAFFPIKDYYSNILQDFENIRSENEILVNTLNKAKSDYKKLVQDYKTLKSYFCDNCMNGGEEFVLDMKSVKSDTSNNIDASDLKADSNFNSENFSLNKRKSIFLDIFF